jgi:hypothetical protein
MYSWLKTLSENPAEFAGFVGPLDAPQAAQAVAAYQGLPADSPGRSRLLRALAADGGRPAMGAFAELVSNYPPTSAQEANLAFVPLFQGQLHAAAGLFPRLLDALAQPTVAGQVLDLANYLTRRGVAQPHPATPRGKQLAELFSGLIQRLQKLAEQPEAFASLPRELGEQLAQGISLAISLCDALALIGDRSLAGKLRPALDVGHRRVRIEAAAALARLGEEEGIETLVALAAEPTVRTRALTYLSELGLLDRAPPEFNTPAARAEGEFVDWLSQPTAFGLQPQELDLIDSRRQWWPGYAEPVDCFLFRYNYLLPGGEIAGVGIAGPVCNAFRADLSAWPVEEIYAAYAGWYAEHEEIREIAAEDVPAAEHTHVEVVAERLREKGFGQPHLVKVGQFFGSEHLVFSAQENGQRGTVIIEDEQADWFPAGSESRPLESTVAYCIFKGRRLLKAFNGRVKGEE